MRPIDPTVAVISSRAPELLKVKLKSYGLRLIEMPTNNLIYDSVCTHPDMWLHFCSGKEPKLFLARECPEVLGEDFNVLLENMKIKGVKVDFAERALQNKYPGNVLLNGVQVGSFLMGNPRTLSSKVVEAHKSEGRTLLQVSQGYTKCSVAVVSEKAFITEDEGIAEVGRNAGLDVLRLVKGAVRLEGFDYGFIGGCAGNVSKHQMLFSGDLKQHPQCSKIERFCERHQVVVECCSGVLTDIGSIIIL